MKEHDVCVRGSRLGTCPAGLPPAFDSKVCAALSKARDVRRLDDVPYVGVYWSITWRGLKWAWADCGCGGEAPQESGGESSALANGLAGGMIFVVGTGCAFAAVKNEGRKERRKERRKENSSSSGTGQRR